MNKPKILILSSNPRNDLQTNREIEDIKGAIKRAEHNRQFEVEFVLEVCTEQLQELFIEHKPRIVHFCGHGTGKQGLVLRDRTGCEKLATTEALSDLFGFFEDRVECVLLNACYSEVQANSIVRHINYAIGMSHQIRDDAAIAFSSSFYRGLSDGQSIEKAYEFGRNGIEWAIGESNNSRFRNESDRRDLVFDEITESAIVPEHLKPVLKKKSPLTPFPETAISVSSNEKREVSKPSDLTPEQLKMLEQALAEEIKYKRYRDRARDNWDKFGQIKVVRQPLTQNEYRQRQTLLTKVKDFWIEGFLKPSLYGNNAINLDWKNNPHGLKHSLEVVEDIPVNLDRSFEELETTDILNQIGKGKTLLILGEPGSGKTIALLQLAKKLITQTERDLSKPIPIVFNLSSWGQKQQPIAKWLIEELKDKYQVPQTWSEPWIEQQQLILLLDGLDEVEASKRDACVLALNRFVVTHNITEMVVCSRVKDYEALNERLQLSSAICIKPLSQDKLYEFLNRAGESLTGLKILLKQDRELEQFAQTPLILNIMSVAYRDWSIKDLLREFRSPGDRYRHLFDGYIERMLHHRVNRKRKHQKNSPQYSQEKVLHWLSWLATKMVEESKTVFLIENMQPTLLENRSEKRWYRIGNFVLGWASVGLMFGLICGLGALISLLYYGPMFGLIGLIFGLIFGLMFGLIGGLIGMLITGLSQEMTCKEITLFDLVNWSWQRAKSNIIHHLKIGITGGLIYGLIDASMYLLINAKHLILNGIIGGIIFGALISILISGLSNVEVKQRTFPNQGIRSSVKNSIKIGLGYGLIFGAIAGLISLFSNGLGGGEVILDVLNLPFEKDELRGRLTIGLFSLINSWQIGGLILGFIFGGATGIRHFNLRRILHKKGRIPWNYARFLDYASERLLMKKVGGGYVFYHRMLMEHFAQRHRVDTIPASVTSQPFFQPFWQSKAKTNIDPRTNTNNSQRSGSVSNYFICPNCTHQNPIDSKFCTKCGTHLFRSDKKHQKIKT